jgi:hypothetical protein
LLHCLNALAQLVALLRGLLNRVACAFGVPRHIARPLARLIRRADAIPQAITLLIGRMRA